MTPDLRHILSGLSLLYLSILGGYSFHENETQLCEHPVATHRQYSPKLLKCYWQQKSEVVLHRGSVTEAQCLKFLNHPAKWPYLRQESTNVALYTTVLPGWTGIETFDSMLKTIF